MLRSFRSVLLAAAVALVVTSAPNAFAAPATSWQSVDVTLHSEKSGATMLVSGELPASASLPAQAELSVPAGSQIQWIGEILGGESSADPELRYTKSSVAGSDVYRFELTRSRVAQIEVPLATAVPFDGSTYTPSITWSATQAIPKVSLRVRIPQGAKIAQQVPGAALEPGGSGYSGYTKTYTDVKAGDKLDLAFAYTAPTAAPIAPATSAPASSTSSSVVPVLIALVAIVAGVALVVSVRKKLARKASKSTGNSGKTAGMNARAAGRVGGKAGTTKARSAAGSETVAAGSGLSGAAKRNLLTAAIIGVLVVAATVVGGQATKPKMTGDTISKTFSQGQLCATATIQVVQKEGADPATTADTLFKALDGVDGMNTGTYNAKTSSIDVGWCASKTTETAVRQALAPTGLIAEAVTPASPALVASVSAQVTTGGQALTVDASSGSFAPTQLTAKAGVPLQITFGQGSGCISEVVFPDLQIRKNLEAVSVTIDLPALNPGSYQFACGMDMQRGTLVVQ